MAKILSLVGDMSAKSAIKWAVGGLTAALAIGVGVGCSSTTTSDPYPTSDSWAEALANAECTGSDPTKYAAGYCGDKVADCVSARTAFHEQEASTIASSTSRKYNSANVPQCLTDTANAYQDGELTPTEVTTIAESCGKVFVGTAADLTGTCTTDFDCAVASDICDPVKLHCGPPSQADNGQCGNIGETCGDAQYCTNSTGVYVCTARPAAGAACSTSIPCGTGFYCDGALCAPALQQGDSCTSSDQCGSGLLCDPYNVQNGSATCDSEIRFAPGATSCDAYGSGGTLPSTTEDAGTTEDAATTTTTDSGSADASGE